MASEEELRRYLKKAAVELKDTQRRLDELEARAVEPIAITGMSCRFPGGVQTPEQFWEVLEDGRDLFGPLPQDRSWQHWLGLNGGSYVSEGTFLYDAYDFDAKFFGIPPIEARVMDPQHRILLEIAWEAIERSRIDPESLRGSATGLYLGMSTQSYEWVGFNKHWIGVEGYLMTGSAVAVAAGRISYTLGLEGPALMVDTSCSSSLTAIHQACAALRSGEVSMALAGGIMVMSLPLWFVAFSRLRALAQNGRPKPFAAAADGTGWGEGAGMLMLERLSDARRNGHPVLAVIRGSAANQDGASNGLTAPSGRAQQKVIRQALSNAKVAAAEVDVVEAHGTGTVLGDPIEAQAVLSTYGKDRPAGKPLWLGSVKSNLGHTQAAAGVAGVIKVVQAMRHDTVPPTLGVDAPTPHVDWDAGDVRLPTTKQPWPRNGHPRRAGVSSFGFSGTNLHVIVEEAPEAEPAEVTEPPRDAAMPLPLVLSGKTEDALRAQAAKLLDWLIADPALDLWDVGFSLATTRTALDHRAAVLAGDREQALAGLAAVAAGQTTPAVHRGRAGQPEDAPVAEPGEPGAAAIAWTGGAEIDWAAVYSGQPVRTVDLPTYAFQRRRFFINPDAEKVSAPTELGSDESQLEEKFRVHFHLDTDGSSLPQS
ncbi:type I polyketide synthase [Nocardia huaxiensis]|uniref:Polyketide synthase docking domain-containing protein n=1 Tax=Nocardia huaxiensis TaxID=2755382 RepID=A0A7D6Z2W8_9NOCA|nr:beta-ketoacyl synthase N-terminal-like domain-containing protein [Nocardia huaxiensis]QLY29584.1 polyketide synthase docking domain-containing protein [Nocardia huaxiensis]UFS96848.1 polyketide synthase docking domain-containing protein [Nocardia huaxiensis]